MKTLKWALALLQLRPVVSCLAYFATMITAGISLGMCFRVERRWPRRNGLASFPGTAYRPVTEALVGLAIAITGCGIAPATSDPEPSDPDQGRFELILFESNDSPDVFVSDSGTQPGLEAMKDHEAVRVLTEQNLIDADWTNRTLVFDESVYAEQVSEEPLFTVSRVFVLVFDGQPLIGGMVINPYFAALVETPVLRPNTYQHDNELVVTLEQNNAGRSGYPVELPALSNEVNTDIQDYLDHVLRSP